MARKKKRTPEQTAKQIEKLERGTRVLDIAKSGASTRAIAEKLKEEGVADVSHVTVHRDLNDALEVLSEQRLESAENLRQLQIESLKSLQFAFWLQAIAGRTEVVFNKKTGEPVFDPKTKEPFTRFIPPSISAGWLVLATIREITDTMNLKKQQFEHTGKDGEPLFPKVYAGFDPSKV